MRAAKWALGAILIELRASRGASEAERLLADALRSREGSAVARTG